MSEGNGFLIECGAPDNSGRRIVTASLGKKRHRDKFDVDDSFKRAKFRDAIIRKFGWDESAHEHLEGKIIAAAEAADSRDTGPLVKANVVNLQDIQAEAVRWFWQGYMPEGAITLLDGDPNEGKSTIAIDLAARFTRGDSPPPHTGPDGTYSSGNVLLIQAEDNVKQATKPRLIAAGARVERVELLRTVTPFDGDDERMIELPLDVPLIEAVIVEKQIALVVLDVLGSFTQDGVSMNDGAAMRRCLAPIALSAERTGATWLVLRHVNKKENTRSMYRGGGAIDIIGAARAGFAVGPHPDDEDQKVFAPVKYNLGPRPASLSYRIEEHAGTSRIVWGGAIELSANDILTHHEPGKGGKVDVAKGIIAESLASGPRGENEVRGACEAAGVSRSTYWRARKDLGVKAEKTEFHGEWLLSLASSNGQSHQEF